MNKAILIGGILAIAVVVAGMTTTTKLALASNHVLAKVSKEYY
jgi:hypothetical protein